jgi:GNAT superfamily N-acetyltransferase
LQTNSPRKRKGISAGIRDFAQAPGAQLFQAPGVQVFEDRRFHASVSSNREWIGVCKLNIAPEEAPAVVQEVHALAPGAEVQWHVVAPADDVVAAMRAAGCRPAEPPNELTFTALATESEPPSVDGIVVRRVEGFDDFLLGLEVMVAAVPDATEWAAKQLADARATYARRSSRPGGQWLAFLDGEAVGYAAAVAGHRGLYLSGGSTIPQVRGRGCYRALIRARWDEAVRRGTPALVVHAQETSRPILERCGFERVCVIHELVSGGSP